MNKQLESEKIEAQLQIFDAKIDEMRAKAAQASADLQASYYKRLEELNQQRQDAGQKFEEFKASTEGAWKEVQSGIEDALNHLQSSLERASSHFS